MPSSSDEVATSARSRPGLQQVLDLGALRPRQRPVVGAHQRLARQLVERRRQPLGQAPAVDEQQRGAVRPHQLQQPRVDRGPDGLHGRALRRRPARLLDRLAHLGHVGDRHVHGELEALGLARVHHRDRARRPAAAFRELGVDGGVGRLLAAPCPAARRDRGGVVPPRKRAISSRLRCVADRPMRCSGLSTMRSRRSSDSAMCAPRLVDTSAWISSTITVSTDRSRSRAFEVSSRNSDSGVVIRMSAGSRWNRDALVGRRVAGANRHRRHVERHALRRGHVGDARQRRAQVALHVHGERLERRQVQHAAARVALGHVREHQAIEARQERGQRLAGAGRRENQRGLAAGNRRPALPLRAGRRLERAAEPGGDRRLKQIEDVRGHEDVP